MRAVTNTLRRRLAKGRLHEYEVGLKSEVQHLSRIRCCNARQTSYQQLQPEERLAIASLRLQDVSIRAMALILGRSPATVRSVLSAACLRVVSATTSPE
uniref:helix-turn-helix domain-containing protein n=1 Tax=Caballeronia terrestris TaxID=1226301 RepID=UPI0035B50E0C